MIVLRFLIFFFVEGYGKVMNEITMKKRIEELYMEFKDLIGKFIVGF